MFEVFEVESRFGGGHFCRVVVVVVQDGADVAIRGVLCLLLCACSSVLVFRAISLSASGCHIRCYWHACNQWLDDWKGEWGSRSFLLLLSLCSHFPPSYSSSPFYSLVVILSSFKTGFPITALAVSHVALWHYWSLSVLPFPNAFNPLNTELNPICQ